MYSCKRRVSALQGYLYERQTVRPDGRSPARFFNTILTGTHLGTHKHKQQSPHAHPEENLPSLEGWRFTTPMCCAILPPCGATCPDRQASELKKVAQKGKKEVPGLTFCAVSMVTLQHHFRPPHLLKMSCQFYDVRKAPGRLFIILKHGHYVFN